MAKHIYVQVGNDVYELEKGQEDLFSSGTLLKPKEGKAKYLAQCKAQLRAYFIEVVSGNSVMFAIVRSVAPSGMSRRISFHVYAGIGMVNISSLVAAVLEWKCEDCTVLVKGCGMDMVHHTAECLSRVLYDGPDRIPTQTL